MWVFGKDVGLVNNIIPTYLSLLLFLFSSFPFSPFFLDIHDWLYILPFLLFLIGLHQNGYTENSRYVLYTSSIRFFVQSSQSLRWEEEDDVCFVLFLWELFWR